MPYNECAQAGESRCKLIPAAERLTMMRSSILYGAHDLRVEERPVPS